MLKRIYICILEIWKSFLLFYDNSIIGLTISKICNGAQKKMSDSIIMTRFRNKFSGMKFFKNSFLSKIISFPFWLSKSVYDKFTNKIENIKNRSAVLHFLNNFSLVPVSCYGEALTSFGTGCLISSFIFGAGSGAVILSLTFIIAGLILCLNKASLKNTFSHSALFGFAAKILFLAPPAYDEKKLVPKGKKLLWSLPFIAGIISAFIGLKFVLLGALAGVFIVLVLWKTIIGVYLVVATCAILPTMALVGLVGLCFVSYILHLAFGKSTKYRLTPFTLLIAAFLFLTGLSAFTSVSPKSSIMAFLVYGAFTLFAPVISNTVTDKKTWQSLVAVFCVSAFFVAFYGVLQNFFLEQTTQSWVDSDMFEDIKTRVYSTLDNPNVLGQYLILAIPLTFACMIKGKGVLSKIVYAGIFLTCTACLLFTWSRAAWVGVVLALVIMLIKKDHRFLAVCVVGIILLPAVLPQSIMARLTSIGNTGDSSTSYRISVWMASINMAKDYFLTGVGLGSDAFATMYKGYALGGASFALHAHNFYLQWIADMGIGGLVVYILIILTAYKCISRIGKGNSLMNIVSYGVAGSLVGYLFQGMAETMWYNYHMILIFWIFMAFAETASNITDREKKEVCRND